MNKTLRVVLAGLLLGVLAAGPVAAQTELTHTTLAAAVTSSSATQIRVTANTGMTVNQNVLIIDQEVMNIVAISGTTITVARGSAGTVAMQHANAAVITVSRSEATVSTQPVGRCTSGSNGSLPPDLYEPIFDTRDGSWWRCRSSVWNGSSTQKLTYNSSPY